MNKKPPLTWQTLIMLLGFIFTVGGVYSEFTSMGREIETLSKRLDKKIQIINQLEEEVHELELKITEHHGCDKH